MNILIANNYYRAGDDEIERSKRIASCVAQRHAIAMQTKAVAFAAAMRDVCVFADAKTMRCNWNVRRVGFFFFVQRSPHPLRLALEYLQTYARVQS